MQTNDLALQFDRVFFSYDEDGENALDGVSLCVKKGEFLAVLGHNGSGKSTLARLADGLLTPTSGDVFVHGEKIGEKKSLFDVRKRVGIVFQNPDNQTVASIVEDDVAFGPENVGVPREEIGERISFALKAVGMEDKRFAMTAYLSGGQKQRVAIAGVLALKPDVMILDESTAMLDPRGRKEVVEIVEKLNKEEGITVVLITHFPEEALLCDRAIVMNKGKIVMEGTPEEVLKKEEELSAHSLALPRAVKVCRTLQKSGFVVPDTLNAKTLAQSLLPQLDLSGAPASTLGVCTRSSRLDGDVGCGVDCENLSYTYNAGSPFAAPALNGVTLRIEEGEFFGVIGHTGSGKSTFVQHLNALIKLPSVGKKRNKNKNNEPACKLIVAGYDLTNKKTDFNRLRSDVGMVFQYPEYQLFAETVFDDVAFGLKNFMPQLSQEERETAVREALETVGLSYEEIKDKSPFELSGGQKRRVAIAGVIVTKPKILVLDEPAAGLDPLGKEQVMSLLHDIHKDWCKTIIVVSHDMEEIAENCTRAVVFSGGNAVRVGTPKELFSCEDISLLGLDVPFVAKVAAELNKGGAALDFDFTAAGFCNAVRDKKRGGDVNA